MELNKYIDLTVLKADTTVSDIVIRCEEARKYGFKSICVNPTHIEHAKELLKGSDVLVCTVIGFPLGANTIECKEFETKDAIKKGADEIDMVINHGRAKIQDYDYIEKEVKTVVSAADGRCVKVIIETSLLTKEETIGCCLAAKRAKATFVKTSTEDVKLMKETVGEMGVKASLVRSKEDAYTMIEHGATRIETSNSVTFMENQ